MRFSSELSPLERYYFPAYFYSTRAAKLPGTKTRIDPLFKTASSKKPELLVPPDVASGRDGDFPFHLSQSALEHGWAGIAKGRPLRDDSAAVEDFLRNEFYQSRRFWQVMAEPVFYSCTFLLASALSAFFTRKELVVEWRALWAAVSESDSRLDYSWNLPANWIGIRGRIGLRWKLSKWVGMPRLKAVLPAAQMNRNIAAQTARMSSSGSNGKPTFDPAFLADSERIQAPDRILQETGETSGNRSNRPAEPRRIFPGKTSARAEHDRPKPWDESHWID
jgi:hypothetical protein